MEEETYVWEVLPMEGESIFVETKGDSVVAAATLYEEQYNTFDSVYAIRKAVETKIKIYDEVI